MKMLLVMPELIAEFTVYGEAKTAGSKKGFVNPKTGKVIITDDTGAAGKNWRSAVADAAVESFVDKETGEMRPVEGAVEVELTFYRKRPKGHFGSGKQTKNVVKDGAPARPITRPDVDKLSRAILDALKGVAWSDDGQITDKVVRKRFAAVDRLEVKIFRADDQIASDLPIEERVPAELRDLSESAQQPLLAA